jgi:hypothetical protein
LPAPRGSRKRPPPDRGAYGSKAPPGATVERDGPRTTQAWTEVPQVDDEAKPYRKPRQQPSGTQPSSARPSRRQGATIDKLLRRRDHLRSLLMTKRAELKIVHGVMAQERATTVDRALAMADDALAPAPPIVKGFHSDGKTFDIWARAIKLVEEER